MKMYKTMLYSWLLPQCSYLWVKALCFYKNGQCWLPYSSSLPRGGSVLRQCPGAEEDFGLRLSELSSAFLSDVQNDCFSSVLWHSAEFCSMAHWPHLATCQLIHSCLSKQDSELKKRQQIWSLLLWKHLGILPCRQSPRALRKTLSSVIHSTC